MSRCIWYFAASKTADTFPLKMICKDASIENEWLESYNPFYGFKKLEDNDAYEKSSHFQLKSRAGSSKICQSFGSPISCFAFLTGISVGEQLALKPNDIDWYRKTLVIRRALSRDINGKVIEGPCKNKYRRRTIDLTDEMMAVLRIQNRLYQQFKGTYFFCTPNGCRVDNDNVNERVWRQALQKVGLEYRSMRQTRHSFATYHLSRGRDPLGSAA